MKGDQISRRLSIVRTSLEAIYAFTHFLAPILPLSSRSIFKNLNTAPRNVMDLRDDFYNLIPGTIITIGDILFQKIEDNHSITSNNNSSDSNHKNRLNNTTTNGKVIISKSNNIKATASTTSSSASTTLIEEIHEIEYTKIDLRIGRIVRIWEHETSDRLYCEDIDIGNNEIRQVASGLRAYYKKEDLLNRLVVVVCNLKESKFQGFVSCGMVLAAKSSNNSNKDNVVDGDNNGSSNSGSSSSGSSSISSDIVQLVDVPSDSQIGERVKLREFEGEYYTPYTAAKVKKMKVWENISVDLHVNDVGVACWKDMQLCNSVGGVCTVQSIINSPIS
jgi:methionine--tRNA ligase beta chain